MALSPLYFDAFNEQDHAAVTALEWHIDTKLKELGIKDGVFHYEIPAEEVATFLTPRGSKTSQRLTVLLKRYKDVGWAAADWCVYINGTVDITLRRTERQ